MAGPFLSLLFALGLLVAGWQGLERAFFKTTAVQTASVSPPPRFKTEKLPTELARHEIIYHNIRQHALSLDADFFRNFADQEVWTILAEVQTGAAAVTLLASIDGTVSLFSSNGQNSLGHGKNLQVQQAAQRLFAKLKDSLPQFVEADEIPLPKKGEFVFYIYGPEGTLTSKIPDFDLDHNHPLYNLMLATNEVLHLMEQNKKESKR
jgi:hypothetical protein